VHRQPIIPILCPVLLVACAVLLAGCCASRSADSADKQQSSIDEDFDEPIAESDTSEGGSPDATVRGERQIALSVDTQHQPANLEPGDRIDLLGAIPRASTFKYKVVMENVEVVAVGERRVGPDAGPRAARYGSIVINIKTDQVKQLFAIQDRLPDGQFRVVLRAPNDLATSETDNAGVVNPKVLEMLRID